MSPARGVWIVLLGPDGAGKSAVIERLESDLAGSFGSVRRFHLRPHFGRRSPDGPPVLDPHAREARGVLGSLAKLGLWWADCAAGYLLAVRPTLRRRGLVVFDRYVDDLLVDPRRYRFRGPMSLARWMTRWTPRPHVVVVLDAPEEILRSRKQEVAVEETARQRSGYRALAARLPEAVVVDASQEIDDVVGDIREIVLHAAEGSNGR